MNLKVFITGLAFLALVACGDEMELGHYTTNLSEVPGPAYLTLMTPDNTGVIPSEVRTLIGHFQDTSPKQLVVMSVPGIDIPVRVMAMAKSVPVVQINLDALYEDARNQILSPEQTPRILREILEKNHTEDVIFFISEHKDHPIDWKVLDNYRVIIGMELGRLHSDKDFMLLNQFVPLPEFITYAEKLGESKQISKEDARKAALLLFVFAPHESFLTAIEPVFDKSAKIRGSDDKMVDSVFAHIQARKVLNRNNFDLRKKMQEFASKDYNHNQLENISNQIHENSLAHSDDYLARTDALLEMGLTHEEQIITIVNGIRNISFIKKGEKNENE